jgi:MurNAc alpha-1-phosphate uridylyltransferase
METIKTAMLFAAGLGTRLKPFTDNHPKAMAIVNGLPLIGHNLKYLKKHGFEKVVINIHHFGYQIVDYVKNNDFGLKIIISDEIDKVLETGGGLVKAKELLDNQPFLVMNVDILTDLDLKPFINSFFNKKPLVLLAVSDRKSSRKLFFNYNENQLVGWKNFSNDDKIGQIENQQPFAFSGIHIIDPKIFDLIEEKGKFSIMTTYLNLMHNHQILGYDHTGDVLIDVGKPEAILEAEKYF